MGALHQGHLSLITRSRADNNVTVCSVFVNPTQFNDPADLDRYPRTPEADVQLLQSAGCDVVFMPEVKEMYPGTKSPEIDLGPITSVLEGIHRPGHFQGVAEVVSRLFDIVQPHRAYFGSKDYQQVLVIKTLVRTLNLPIEIISCPTVREADGLAMSSRNTLLNAHERQLAGKIPHILKQAAYIALNKGIDSAKKHVEDAVKEYKEMRLEYFEICDTQNLQPITGSSFNNAVGLIAVYVNKIRLIDNVELSSLIGEARTFEAEKKP